MAAFFAHRSRDGSRFEWSEYPESSDRAALRRKNAADGPPSHRGWPNPTQPCHRFRNTLVNRGGPSVGRGRASQCEPACAIDARLVFIFLHAPQTANATVHFHRSILRRYARVDWIRRSGWETQLTGLAALRDCFPLAISSFHGDCVDIPRGLRAGRLRDPSAE